MNKESKTRTPWYASAALWSLVAAVLLVMVYLWPAYRDSTSQFDTGNVLANMRASLLQPSLLWWQLGHFAAALLACHFLFFYLLAEVARIRHAGRARLWRTLALWAAGLLFLHTVNSGYFPHSNLAFDLVLLRVAGVVAAAFLILLLALGAGHLWWRAWRRRRLATLVPSVLVAGVWLGYTGLHWATARPQGALPADKPNIILIGVDSLRPDMLAYMNAWNAGYESPMPFLDKQLSQSVVFNRAYTPVARTYPSWMAILTGQDSLHSNVRSNLQDDYGWWRGKTVTLPQYLREHGYQTVWAIDGSAFANIGNRQGFDTVLSPEPGAAGILVSKVFSDIPMVNVFANLVAGRWLFPLVFANRARGYAYYPSTFSGWLTNYVRHSDEDKPLFMAVHFELPHYPGIWANDGLDYSDIYKHPKLVRLYTRYALKRVDLQIANLMRSLRQDGRLDNAIVMFLSDHGNGFGTGKMGTDRLGARVYVGDTSYGHGTDPANLAQHHMLLAMRGYGQSALDAGYRDTIVSAMDIAPTLLSMLDIQPNEPMQGIPLAIRNKPAPPEPRTVYLESGFNFPGLASGNMDLAAYLAEAASWYRIRQNGRLVLREERLPRAYRLKYRVAYNGDYLIGEYTDFERGHVIVYAIDATTGEEYKIDAKSLQRPRFRALARNFCRHYAQHDPYFTSPSFCLTFTKN